MMIKAIIVFMMMMMMNMMISSPRVDAWQVVPIATPPAISFINYRYRHGQTKFVPHHRPYPPVLRLRRRNNNDSRRTCRTRNSSICCYQSSANNNENEEESSDGASLAAEFFQLAQSQGLRLDVNDLLLDDDDDDDDEEEQDDHDDGKVEKSAVGANDKSASFISRQTINEDEHDDDDDDEDDDEDVSNIPQGAINVFLGYDTGGSDVGGLAGNVSLTDNQLYSEVKERVLDTAGGFVEYIKTLKDDENDNDDDDMDDGDDNDDDDDKDEDIDDDDKQKKDKYIPPTIVPDPDLTAGEVVLLILQALLHNDVPTPNRGVEILFGYSSPGSSIKNEIGLTVREYAEFLQETEYKVLFHHTGQVSIDKGDYSFDGKKGYFTARLSTGPHPVHDIVSVNFILSTTGVDDDASWLIDSMLIRPTSMRRRRRR
jgi:hypothetical protein